MFSIYQALKKYGVATTKNIQSNNKKDVEVVKMLGGGDEISESVKKLPDPVPAVARADLGVPPPPPAIFQVAPVNESQVQLRLSSNYSIHSFSTFRAPSC